MKRFVVMGLLLAGCSGGAGASDQPTSVATPTQSVESSASPPPAVPSPSDASDDGGLCAEGFETCTLEPGTYSAAPFEPGFMFTIEEEWTNDRAYADGGGISLQTGGVYWASGVTDGTVADEPVEIGAGIDGFVLFLQSLTTMGMTVSEPVPVTIDGVEGQQIDLETNDAEARGLYFIEDDAFNLIPQEKARFLVLEKEGETVLLIVDAFVASDFDEWVETAQPVVDSIVWE